MARSTGSGDDERRRARSPEERDASPKRDPQRLESEGKRLHADAPTDRPMPDTDDREDEFPER